MGLMGHMGLMENSYISRIGRISPMRAAGPSLSFTPGARYAHTPARPRLLPHDTATGLPRNRLTVSG
jgi:hypothetical protein